MTQNNPNLNAVSVDPVEAAIEKARQAQRVCEQCGPRPEFDALYCSWCGREIATHNDRAETEGGI